MSSILVTVVEIRNFKLADGATSDPYCKLTTGADYELPVQTTCKSGQAGSCVWEEQLRLSGKGRFLTVEVIDKNILSDVGIGKVEIPISHFADQQPHDEWYRLSGGGQIHLRVHYTDTARPPATCTPFDVIPPPDSAPVSQPGVSAEYSGQTQPQPSTTAYTQQPQPTQPQQTFQPPQPQPQQQQSYTPVVQPMPQPHQQQLQQQPQQQPQQQQPQQSYGGYQQPQQGGYPQQPQQGGYPPQQQQQGGYPPQQQQQQGGYPPMQQGGYPQQQQPGYVLHTGGWDRFAQKSIDQIAYEARMNPQQVISMQQHFQYADRDRSGTLSRYELESLWRTAFQQEPNAQLLDLMFEVFDKTRSGSLSFNEFIYGFGTFTAELEEFKRYNLPASAYFPLRRGFHRADRDGSGKVSLYNEIRQFLKLGDEVPLYEVARMAQRPADRDSELSFGECIPVIYQISQTHPYYPSRWAQM